jgi:hypothetical protein
MTLLQLFDRVTLLASNPCMLLKAAMLMHGVWFQVRTPQDEDLYE